METVNNNELLSSFGNVRIIGKIVNIKYNKEINGTEITVISKDYDIPLHITSFFPIKFLRGDSVCGNITYINDRYIFIDEPIIEPVVDRNSIE